MSVSERRTPAPDRAGELQTLELRVPEMDCPSCIQKIRSHLSRLDGVEEVEGSPIRRSLAVRHRPEVSAERVRRELAVLGYASVPAAVTDAGRREARAAARGSIWRGSKARRTYLSMALFAAGALARLVAPEVELVRAPLHVYDLADFLFLAAALAGGSNFFGKGVRAAVRRNLDMNVLMTVAIVGAVAIGEVMEGAAIAFLFSLAELLEGYAADRAHRSVEALMELAPDSARVLKDGEEVVVAAEELRPGDVIVVRPGERIAADGTVVTGASAVDQSPVTGESLPVDLGPGDPAFAGSINHEGYLEIRVDRPAGESTVARIARLVTEAEKRKSRAERFVERFARVYTPMVTLAAVLVIVGPPLLWGAPFTVWFVRGLTLLVIACPCALVISTPVAVVSGITAGARRGVLVKGGVYLEAMSAVEALALDKTGTLTVGHLEVVEVVPRHGVDARELLRLASAVESRSEHPIARAVVEHAEEQGVAVPTDVADFVSEPGRGAMATIEGKRIRVGRSRDDAGVPRRPGHTSVEVRADDRLLGWLVLRDTLRPGAREALAALRSTGIRHLVMLTGDMPEAARLIAREVGVDEVRAGLLPEEKVAVVEELESRWGPVAMVGDGVNDAPALARATVGIAMGAAGTDAALETADVALMGDDLSRLAYLRRLSTRARAVIRENISVAIGVKMLLALGVPFGVVPLVAAVLIGDMGVSLLVIVNALRLSRLDPEERAG